MKTFYAVLLITIAFLNRNAHCQESSDVAYTDKSYSASPEIYSSILEPIVSIDASNDVMVELTMESEVQNHEFVIEKSTDLLDFIEVDFIIEERKCSLKLFH